VSFGYAVLTRRVWNRFFVRNASVLAILLKLASDELGRIVDAKCGDFRSAEVLGVCTEIVKVIGSFFARFHEVK
jgi:hypothetical protein